MQRHLLGILGICLLAVGIVLSLQPIAWSGTESLRAAAFRLGPFLIVLWLGFPHLQRLPQWVFWVFPLLLYLLAFRPRWFFVVLPVLVMLIIVSPRRGRGGTAGNR
jgi:hypothetical protein